MSAATMTRERPILFSGPMVRALLDGRKTQTRRVVKRAEITRAIQRGILNDCGPAFGPCPYGAPGDRLWVREAYRYRHERDWIEDASGSQYRDVLVDQEHARYEADLRVGIRRDNERGAVERVTYLHESTPIEDDTWLQSYRRRPSIHMPRWACRLVLELTDVRVERVHDISEDDARAEGVVLEPYTWRPLGSKEPMRQNDHRHQFSALWDSLNAPRGYGWAANPWVWVLTFRRVEAA